MTKEEMKKAYGAMYYAAHKERAKKNALDYYYRHKEERRAYSKRYKEHKKAREDSIAGQNES